MWLTIVAVTVPFFESIWSRAGPLLSPLLASSTTRSINPFRNTARRFNSLSSSPKEGTAPRGIGIEVSIVYVPLIEPFSGRIVRKLVGVASGGTRIEQEGHDELVMGGGNPWTEVRGSCSSSSFPETVSVAVVLRNASVAF